MDYYPPLSSRAPLLPSSLIPSLMLPTVLALSLPPNRFTSFALLFIFFAILSQTPFYTTGATDYVEGCMAGMALLQFITLVFWSNPRRDSWRLDEPLTESSWETKSTLGRAWWSWRLVLSAREIGFSTQAKNVPAAAPEKQSVWVFSLRQLVRALWFFLLYDICEVFCQHQSQGGLVSVLSQPLPRQIQLTWVAAFKSYFQLELQYAAGASLTTMLRLYKPQDWPPLFGRWADAWSVRRFWGRTWHQMLRNMLTRASSLMTDSLDLRSGTLQSTYAKLFLSFLLSAFVHYTGGIFAAREELGEYKFFLLQAVAITIENGFLWLWKTMGWKGGVWGRILGYVWFISFMTWTARDWMDGRVRGGEWNGRQIPFGIVERFWK